jgi:hypothetical protein
MTDNKAALDALEHLYANTQDYNGAMQHRKTIEAALTTPPAPTVMGDDVREAVKTVRHFIAITSDSLTNHAEIQAIETLIRAATHPQPTDAPCRTCKGDPETCADVPDARRVYGFHNGKALSCHPLGVESAIETFLRFNGAVFVDGKPVEKFGIATGAMSSAIQAYLDYYRNGVGDTNETRKSH